MLTGFAVLFTAYSGYAFVLGGIDGLTPLPREFYPPDSRNPVVIEMPWDHRENPADVKLLQAFGERSPVLNRGTRLEIRNKRCVVAVDYAEIEQEGPRKGQVRLQPFSIALFGKDDKAPRPGEPAFPEINTVSSDIAYLRFDEPVASLSELNDRQLVE